MKTAKYHSSLTPSLETPIITKSICSVSAILLATLSFGALAEDAAVNCDTAQQDLSKLQAEKKSTVEQMARGVSSITPAGFVLNTLAGTEKESQEIGTGEYNQRIDVRIALIKSTCGIE